MLFLSKFKETGHDWGGGGWVGEGSSTCRRGERGRGTRGGQRRGVAD